MLVGLINPAAGRVSAVELAHVLASSSPRLRLVMSDQPSDIDALIRSLNAVPAELIVIGGGDGTLCNLLTRFDAAGRLDQVPPLLALPAGRINTIASALVGSEHPARLAQRILLAWTRGVRRLQRVPIVRVRVDGQPSRVGMTASIGAVARIHADYRQGPYMGVTGVGLTLTRLALQRLAGDRFAPIRGKVQIEPGLVHLPVVTAGVLSALPCFFKIVKPFPGVHSVAVDGLHMALSALGPMASQAAVLGMVRGNLSNSPHLQFGTVQRLSWRNGSRPDLVILDGEPIEVAPHAQVTIEVAAKIRMVVWRALPRPG